jgi:CRP/FNR family transcriptional regulator, cyclic AMP receptor protein
MPSILELLNQREVRRFRSGETVIREGEQTGLLFFLIEGAVEVHKGEVLIYTTAEPGTVFGEFSALLGGNHLATVNAVKPSAFYVVENPRAFLAISPEICFHVCETLASRLNSLMEYLRDVKGQFEDHGHIGMVDEVLQTLMHRKPRIRTRPSESTIHQGEPLE